MKCPFCKRPLVPGESKKYETLADHVFDPNKTDYPLRPTFICGCLLSQGAYWDEYGDFYWSLRDYAKYVTLRKYGDPLAHGNLHAIDSPSWQGIRERRRSDWLMKNIAPYRWYMDWRWRRVARKMGMTV